MSEKTPIPWIRELYKDCDESIISEAESNFNALVDYLASLDNETLDKLKNSFLTDS